MVPTMTNAQALDFLAKRAKDLGGWEALGEEMGIPWATIYGWYRRSKVPDWRLEKVEAESLKKAA